MKNQISTYAHKDIHAMILRSLLLFVLLGSFATTAMACGYGLRSITPGQHNFEQAILANKYMEHKVSTHTAYRHTQNGLEAFTYKTLEFTGIGVTLVSEEVKGESFNSSLKKTKIAATRFNNIWDAQMYAHGKREALYKIEYQKESPQEVEKALGKASAKSGNSLEYARLGLRFEFAYNQDSGKLDKIKMIEWRA